MRRSCPHHRRRHRLVAPASIVLAIGLAVTACGGAEQPAAAGGDGGATTRGCPVEAFLDADGVTEVTLWHAWVGLSKITLEQIAADYNASQDRVRVSVEAQGNFDEQLQKYESSIGRPDQLPHVMAAAETSTQFLIDSDTVVPVETCLSEDPDAGDFYDQVLPAVIANYSVEDTLWPGAFGVAQPILYVNENHFRAAGLSTATEDLPQTLDEIREAAEAIVDAGVPGVTRPLVGRMESWFFEDQLTGARQLIVNQDNGRSGLATGSEVVSDTSRSIVDWYRSMYDDELYNATPYSQPYDQVFAMALGTSSMLIDTSSAITSVNGAIEGTLTNEEIGAEDLDIDLSTIRLEGLEVGVGPSPGVEAAGQGKVGGSAFYLVDTGDDAALSAAWDFMKFFNSTPSQVRWTVEGSFLPVSDAARNDDVVLEEFRDTRRGRWLAIASGSLDGLDADFPGPAIGPYNEFQAGVRTMFEQVIFNGEDAGAALSELGASFQSELEAYADEVTR